MSGAFFSMEGINKYYTMGDERIHVLKDISLHMDEGEYLSVLGPSGSGKSTLMNLIGCLDTPTSGRYVLGGSLIGEMTEQELAQVRSREIGFIFQNSQLMPRLDAMRNVEMPLVYAGVRPRERRRRAAEMLERVGRSAAAGRHCPGAGGQPQTAAGRRTDRRAGSENRQTGDDAVSGAER